MTIGENIRKYRKEKKVTLKILGNYLKISEQAVSQYERGIRTPNTKTIYKIADFFNVPAHEIDYELYHFTESNDHTSHKIKSLSDIDKFIALINHSNLKGEFPLIVTDSIDEFLDQFNKSESGERPCVIITNNKKTIELNIQEVSELFDRTCRFLTFELIDLFKKKDNVDSNYKIQK